MVVVGVSCLAGLLLMLCQLSRHPHSINCRVCRVDSGVKPRVGVWQVLDPYMAGAQPGRVKLREGRSRCDFGQQSIP